MYKSMTTLTLLTAAVFAMDPKTYFTLEVETLKLTKQSLQRELQCLQSKECDLDKRIQIAEEAFAEKERLFRDYNTTPSKHLFYYTRHKKELDPLYSSGEYAETISQLQEEIDTLSETVSEYSGKEER